MGEPSSIGRDNLGHIGRLSVNRKLTCPGKCGATPFARLGKRTAIAVLLFLSQGTLNSSGQVELNKRVLFQHYLFARRRPQRLERLACWLRILTPAIGLDNR